MMSLNGEGVNDSSALNIAPWFKRDIGEFCSE